MISRRTGVWVLVGFTILVVAAAVLLPRIPQPQSYHDFADQRALLGTSNFGDVVSNLLFAVGGAWGLIFLLRKSEQERFLDPRERWAYLLVFLGLLLTALGSSYYHLAPDNGRLVWDRLPMTLAFMGLVSAMISERLSVPAGCYLLPVLLLIGAGSVVWWWHTETAGASDLRFYAAVQVYAVLVLPILLLLSPRYTRSFGFRGSFRFLRVGENLRNGGPADLFARPAYDQRAHAEALGCGRGRILDTDDAAEEEAYPRPISRSKTAGLKPGLYIL